MTTAKELGFRYDTKGKLVRPHKEIRLNENGARFVTWYALIFGYDIGEVQPGFVVEHTSEGIDKQKICLDIPDQGKVCGVNVYMGSDYFEPLPKNSN